MRLFDGRSEFYQYDLNQKLICDSGSVGDEVHFSNRFYSKAAVCVTYELDGLVVVDVPNSYLLGHGELTAYHVCCDGDQTSTVDCCTFTVVARKKPTDYVYSETEVKSYEALEARIEHLENGGYVGGEGSTGKDGKDGVGIQYIERTNGDGSAGTTDTYTIVLTDGTSYTFTVYNGKDGADGVGGGSGGADGTDGITPHIGSNGNWYLGTTDTGVKAKGEDGLNGKDGIDGQDGYTPVKGVDYFDGVDGKDGITPHIGENKNWFIGDTDTGIRAEGKDGQDGSDGSGGSSMNVYSTEEIVFGTWYNGKPVYRRTFVGVFPSTAGSLSVDANPVYDDIVSQYGYFDKVYGRTPFPWFYKESDNRGFFTVYSNRLSLVFGGEPVGAPYVITIEYTKTTDTATVAIPSATALMDAYEEGVNEA